MSWLHRLTWTPSPELVDEDLGSRKRLLDETNLADAPVAKRQYRKRECTICCEDKAINTFPREPHAGSGDHSRDACRACWKVHINSVLENGNFEDAKCLHCDQVLDLGEIRKLISKPELNKCLDKAAELCMKIDEEFVSCAQSTCTWGCYMPKKNAGNIFTCQACESRYCIACQVPMHESMTCQQYKDLQAHQEVENAESATKINKTTKACPKCFTRIEKSSGCNHMTCVRCRHEFCWLCFAAYRGPQGILVRGNAFHDPTCAHHTNNIAGRPLGS